MINEKSLKASAPRGLINCRGSVLVLVGISMVVLIGIVAIAVDIGYVMVTKNELQNIADATALAGTRALGKKYEPMTFQQQADYVCDPVGDKIVEVVQYVAGENEAGQKAIQIKADEIEVGRWDATAKTFEQRNDQPDAVRITARRDGLMNSPIATFFARIFGINDASVSATAVAALTGLSTIEEGELDLPIGISDTWFAKGWECGQNIYFYPTNDSCAGWTNWTDAQGDKVSDNDLKNDILPGLIAGTLTAPGATYNETKWWFSGGNLSQPTWTKLDELFQAKKDANGEWKVQVVVYHFSGDSDSSCGNPNPKDGPLTIVGFATLVMKEVLVPPSKEGGEPQKSLTGAVYCNYVEDGRGSGGNYGTKGSIPNLVK